MPKKGTRPSKLIIAPAMTSAREPSAPPAAAPDPLPRTLAEAFRALPVLMTVGDMATLLRTTPYALYARAERGQLPGLIRDGRRLRFDRALVLRWLEERRATSPGGIGR